METEPKNLLITSGTIIDGTGAPPYRADLIVKDGRIAEIIRGDEPRTHNSSLSTLDCTGLIVAPGFVDIHSHSDFTLLVDPRAVSQISQGVTTEVVGNCGHGCAPIRHAENVKSNIYGYRSDYALDWHSMAEYLARLDAAKPAVNVATLVPNGNVRLAAVQQLDRASTPDELDAMKRLLAESLEAGAFGYSTGLEYGPERACSEEEIQALCGVAKKYGRMYATHTRNREGEAKETIAEAIRASAAADVPLQISHISSVARLADDGHWAVRQAIEQVDEARARGLDVMFDMHTRLFGTTNLTAALPPWVLEGSKLEIEKRLRDLEIRREMKQYRSIMTALARDDWSRIVLFDSKAQPELSRKSIAEIAAARGVDAFDAIYDILLAELDNMHELMVIAFAYREEDIRQAYEHPLCMVGSDATALATDGVLQGTSFHGGFTWAAWFIHHFTRETNLLTLPEAIRRITSLPASRLGLNDRGVIRRGAWADLAIFDAAEFRERGTTFEPNQIATGMKHVFVNGVAAVKNGKLTTERSGQVLRK